MSSPASKNARATGKLDACVMLLRQVEELLRQAGNEAESFQAEMILDRLVVDACNLGVAADKARGWMVAAQSELKTEDVKPA